MENYKQFTAAIISVLLLAVTGNAAAYEGRVVDSSTGKPIEGAFVTAQNQVARTGKDGGFRIEAEGGRIGARAPGYLRQEVDTAGRADGEAKEIRLTPFAPKALYLSFYGAGSSTLRQSALKLIEETDLNALVIDVKGDLGMIPYKSAIPLVAEVGGQKITTIRDIRSLIASLREKGIYTIARIVTFKDDPLATAKPEWAVKTRDGAVWRDRENLAWVDPFRKEVWEYNIEIAVEAAKNGFDEIQFDYVRFPDARGPEFSQPNTEANRVRAITGFLTEARARLAPYNVFLAADLFGYVSWNTNDTDIGQKLEELAPVLDYFSPMLYPSGFQYGIPNYRQPVENPYEIVFLSLKRAKERTGLPGLRFRPWLQAFKDYAFDHRPFGPKEIGDQIRAAEDFGANGWMLWNPRNVYSDEALKKGDTQVAAKRNPRGDRL
ncbi:MAG: putative glycoside hydrolase [Pseudomonadota bacterium]